LASYPEFICIGTQKAGTTWLDEMLRGHPDIWLPPVKELQYFNERFISGHKQWTRRHRITQGLRVLNWQLEKTRKNIDFARIKLVAHLCLPETSDEWYGEIFDYAPAGRVRGEVTPEYAILPEEGIRHILSLRDDARFILILRDPIDRAWSHARMLLKDRLNETAERILAWPDVLARGHYKAMLERWFACIDPANMLVLFNDHIRKRPAAVMEQVCSFLGVRFEADFFPNLSKEIHKGAEGEISPQIYETLRTTYEEDIRFLASMYEDPGRAWLARHFGLGGKHHRVAGMEQQDQ
jgi:hypothetical protein